VLSRRKRLVVRALVVSAVVVVVAVAVVFRGQHKTYRPGEQLEGLTETLSREMPDDYTPVRWRDVTSDMGIDFRHFSGVRSIQLPEDIGSGAAWADYDGDGWIDLFLTNVSAPMGKTGGFGNALYRNVGGKRFENVTEAAAVVSQVLANAAAWGDFDNDGNVDLVVAGYGELTLYQNAGNGRFEVARGSGLEGFEGFWAGVSWSDYDRDGDLDLYVCGYVRYTPLPPGQSESQYQTLAPATINPSSFEAERNLLFRNDGGAFVEVGSSAGVANPDGKSLSAIWWDFDNDGWSDLYVANDVSDNALFRNLGDGSFEDVSLATFVADYRGAMGLAAGDADNDGDLDMFVTHWIAQENALYENLYSDLTELEVSPREALRFADNAEAKGLGQVALDYVGWGTAFLDFDLDTRLDLVIANGHTLASPEDPQVLTPMTSQLFWNAGGRLGYYDVSTVSGPPFQQEVVGRGLAVADYDNDGDPDVLVVAHGGPCVLLRNEQETGHRWLKVDLGPSSASVGARVTVVVGKSRQIRESTAGSSYCSQHSPNLLFGLGDAELADSVIVRWPLGEQSVLTDVAGDQLLRIGVEEGQ
jgi:enediyne biosynthesis protein E4